MEIQLLTYLIPWFFLWLFVWSVFYILIKKGVDYIHHFIITSVYFLIASLALMFFFRSLLAPITENFTLIPFVALFFGVALSIFLHFICHKYFSRPKKLLKRFPHEFIIKMDYHHLFSKSFEILFQQVMIVSLVVMLSKAGISFAEIMFAFALVFGLSHVPLFRFMKKFFAEFYIVSSIISALAFPLLILKLNYGFVYSYIAHYLFYTLAGMFFWKHYK